MFVGLIRQRRSIRKFKNKPIEPEKLELLIEAALRSPSSRSLNPWEFIVIRDLKVLELLSKAKPHGSAFLSRAPLGVVVCADPKLCDVWIEDTSIATTFIQLTAESIGLSSCWIQIRCRMHDQENTTAEDYVRNTLEIPSKLNVLCIIAIGYPDEQKDPHPESYLQMDKIHYERYGCPNK